MTLGDRLQCRGIGATGLARGGAARREVAAPGAVGRSRRTPRDRLRQQPIRDARDRCDQGAGIGVARRGEDVRGYARLDDAAGIHHGKPMTEMGDDSKIMADADQGHAFGAPQIRQKIQDPELRRHVEACCRLVQQQRLGFSRQRHGDGHALQLAA